MLLEGKYENFGNLMDCFTIIWVEIDNVHNSSLPNSSSMKPFESHPFPDFISICPVMFAERNFQDSFFLGYVNKV